MKLVSTDYHFKGLLNTIFIFSIVLSQKITRVGKKKSFETWEHSNTNCVRLTNEALKARGKSGR